MFKLKYNLLVIIQVVVGLLNAALLMRVFGISAKSDAYLLSYSIVVALQWVLLLPLEQFMHFYNDLKVKSIEDAHSFYNITLLFSLLVGIISFIFIHFGLNLIISLFALKIDYERLTILKDLLSIFTVGLMFYPIIGINERLLNAEMRFSVPYVLNIIPVTFIVIAQLILIYYNSTNVIVLAYAQAIAMICVALFGTFFISKNIISLKLRFRHPIMKKYIKNSFAMQFGNCIYQFLFPIVLNNFLITFPKGYVSYFYYARKIIDIVNTFVLGPSTKILQSRISQFVANKNTKDIKVVAKKFLIFMSLIFLAAATITYFVQSPIITLITGGKFTAFDLRIISLIFLSLVPWYFIAVWEAPFDFINTAAKKSYIVIIMNSTFIVLFAALTILLKSKFYIYTIPIAMILAQIVSLTVFSRSAIKTLKKFSFEQNPKILELN